MTGRAARGEMAARREVGLAVLFFSWSDLSLLLSLQVKTVATSEHRQRQKDPTAEPTILDGAPVPEEHVAAYLEMSKFLLGHYLCRRLGLGFAQDCEALQAARSGSTVALCDVCEHARCGACAVPDIQPLEASGIAGTILERLDQLDVSGRTVTAMQLAASCVTAVTPLLRQGRAHAMATSSGSYQRHGPRAQDDVNYVIVLLGVLKA